MGAMSDPISLLRFLSDMPRPEREAFAVRCGTTYGHLRNCAYGWDGKKLGPKECVAVERESAGRVTRQVMRPDDYWEIWPDLPQPTPVTQAAQPA